MKPLAPWTARVTALVIVGTSLVFTMACSSGADAPAVNPGGDSAIDTKPAKDAPLVDDTPEPPATCTKCSTEFSGDPPAKDYSCIKTLDAAIVDVDGKPVPKVTIMACSAAVCINGPTDAAGKVHLVPCRYLPSPVFKVFGFSQFVPFSVPIRNPTEDFAFDKVAVIAIPATGIAFKVGEAQTLTMAGLTLDVAPGTDNVKVDPFAPYTDFRATRMPIDKLAPGLDPGLKFDLVYGLGPQNSLFNPPAKLTVANEKGWPAGTAVEVYQHNYELLKDVPVKMGEWWKVATGKVSADGKTISTDAGTGLTMLTMIGVRRAP